MKTKHCQWCDNNFETSISYQVYCSAECRELATKEKIAQRYAQTRIKQRLNKDRKCKNCGVGLSIYNDDTLCFQCIVNQNDVDKVLKNIKGMANGKDSK